MREFPHPTCTMVKRSFFAKGTDGRYPLNDTIEAIKGIYTSMKLTGVIPSYNAGTGLDRNVNISSGIVWTSQILHQCARNLCKI
jgi:eukaryotic translation initiation factor 2C